MTDAAIPLYVRTTEDDLILVAIQFNSWAVPLRQYQSDTGQSRYIAIDISDSSKYHIDELELKKHISIASNPIAAYIYIKSQSHGFTEHTHANLSSLPSSGKFLAQILPCQAPNRVHADESQLSDRLDTEVGKYIYVSKVVRYVSTIYKTPGFGFCSAFEYKLPIDRISDWNGSSLRSMSYDMSIVIMECLNGSSDESMSRVAESIAALAANGITFPTLKTKDMIDGIIIGYQSAYLDSTLHSGPRLRRVHSNEVPTDMSRLLGKLGIDISRASDSQLISYASITSLISLACEIRLHSIDEADGMRLKLSIPADRILEMCICEMKKPIHHRTDGISELLLLMGCRKFNTKTNISEFM